MVTLGCSSGRVAQGFWSTGDDPALGEGCMEMIGWWRLFRLDARVSCTFMYVPPASTTRVKRIPGNTFASVTEGSEVPFKSSHPPTAQRILNTGHTLTVWTQRWEILSVKITHRQTQLFVWRELYFIGCWAHCALLRAWSGQADITSLWIVGVGEGLQWVGSL